MRFKTLILALMILVTAAFAYTAETVTISARGTAGHFDWTRGTVLWETGDTYAAPEILTCEQLGLGSIGMLQLAPYGGTIFFGHPTAITNPNDSISVAIYYAAADSSLTVAATDTFTADVKFIFFAISK